MTSLDSRFEYLETVLEDDQDKNLFKKTRDILLVVLGCVRFDTNPEIGVDDEGRSIAEWHDYDDYLFFSIIPYSEEKILFEGVKKDNTSFSISTGLKSPLLPPLSKNVLLKK